jgi:uncharacterized membrane protein YtjA (UPF0391 family)
VQEGFCSCFCANFRRLTPRNNRSERGLTFQSKRHAKGGCAKSNSEVSIMLGWVVTFLIVALIAGLLGFGGIAGASIEIAKIIFVIALVLFLVSALLHVTRGRRI